MIDFEIVDNKPVFSDTIVHKAANVVITQEGSLYYSSAFGIDLNRFFDPDVEIQTETFKSYSVQKLAENGVNVLELTQKNNILESIFNYVVQMQEQKGFVAQ